jgi:hypothetical protein
VRVSNRICRQDGSRRMANSSNVVREGDDGLQKKSQRIFCVQRGGLGLSYICMPDQGADQKKKVQGNLSQSPGGGMMMLDGCAGLGEHGRKKTNRNEQPRRGLAGLALGSGRGQ